MNCLTVAIIDYVRLRGLPSIPLPWRVILKDQIEYCHCTLAALEFQILTFILLPHWLYVFSPFSWGNMHRFVECVLNPTQRVFLPLPVVILLPCLSLLLIVLTAIPERILLPLLVLPLQSLRLSLTSRRREANAACRFQS